MTDETVETSKNNVIDDQAKPRGQIEGVFVLLVALLLGLAYWRAVDEMVTVWNLQSSYYTHGYLVPLVSLAILWMKRRELAATPRSSDPLGFAVVLASGLFLILSSFLGYRVFMQLSLIPMLAGVALVLQGRQRTKVMWFPIAYLIFMVPIPPSMTQSIALQLKFMRPTLPSPLRNG